jgi:hypothetical protein
MTKRLGLMVIGALLVSTSALADGAAPAAAPAPAHSGAAYGTAGCGLGSLLFGNKPGIIQIFAATTNGTSGNQTFGITTGTSNCSDTGGGSASAKIYIQANREALAKDIARGQGETLANLSTLAGCGNTAAVGPALQKKFTAIFPAASTPTDQVSDSILSTLKSDATLACSNLG